MLNVIAGGVLAAALAAAPQTDTTFRVDPGARLELHNQGGDITVRSWDRAEVRVEAEHSPRTRVSVTSSGSVVQLRARSERGPATIVDYRITVPAGMSLDLAGTYSDIRVEGARGEVKAVTVQGEVAVEGGRSVTARSVQGSVAVRGTRGDVHANSISADVRISDVVGEVTTETVSGDIVLERIDSRRVDAGTVSGDVYYDGSFHGNGRYSFVTHSGDVTAAFPAGASASVTVATLDGDLDASFPVPGADQGGRRHSFTLGSGSAQVEMETFSGDVHLRRPGEVRAPAPEAPRDRRSPGAPPRPPRVPGAPGVPARP